jgi:hypothetical protein
MCEKFITVYNYRPCGRTDTRESIVACDDLMEGNCAGVTDIHTSSTTKKTKDNWPNHGEEKKEEEKAEENKAEEKKTEEKKADEQEAGST